MTAAVTCAAISRWAVRLSVNRITARCPGQFDPRQFIAMFYRAEIAATQRVVDHPDGALDLYLGQCIGFGFNGDIQAQGQKVAAGLRHAHRSSSCCSSVVRPKSQSIKASSKIMVAFLCCVCDANDSGKPLPRQYVLQKGCK